MKTLRLMGEKRIKMVSSSMLLLSFIFIPLFTLIIHTVENDNLILYLLLYIAYGLAIVSNIYMLINTSCKLIKSQFLSGLSLVLLSLTLFVVALFIFFGNTYSKITIFSIAYIILLIFIEWIFRKLDFYSLRSGNKSVKIGISISASIFGILIGKCIGQNVISQYGENTKKFLIIICILLISITFGVAGIFYINKYFAANKFEYMNSIFYDNGD